MDFKRFAKYFFATQICFILGFLIFFAPFYNIKAALVIGATFGSLFGMFVAGHLERNLKRDKLIINSKNRNPKYGLNYYLQEIEQYLIVMRYQETENEDNYRVFTPRPRLRVMGGNIKLKSDPYEIEIEAPIGVIRILSSQLDLEKIFL